MCGTLLLLAASCSVWLLEEEKVETLEMIVGCCGDHVLTDPGIK